MSNIHNASNNKRKNAAVLALTTLLLLLLIAIVGVAYAKFISSASGTASAQVANMICNLNVSPCDPTDPDIIDPYCTLTITDFNTVNNQDKITEASYNYTVSVSLNQESVLDTLPAYYWTDASGNPVGTPSQPLTGSFTKGSKETQTYRVYFVNAGTAITAKVDFDITAVQKSNN